MAVELNLSYMHRAIALAQEAAAAGEVPVGAVVVDSAGQVIGWGRNRMETLQDATAHAEMAALQQAAATLGHWRLNACVLYVTLEPCPMCAGAMVQCQLGGVVFGASDPKAGAAGSLFQLADSPLLNHRVAVLGGILEGECARMLQEFFAQRRQQKRATPR